MAKVAVIVPIYNVEKYVLKCIKSLLKQTFSDIEIYAVSDGSPDNSMKILQQITDNRLQIIEKENGGYGSVLEYSLKRINSEYFLICDPDDWLEENAIEKLVETADKCNSDLVFSDINLVYSDGIIKPFNTASELYKIEYNTIYTDLTNFAFASWSPHAKLYKTSIGKSIIFPHKVNFTDQLLYLVFLSNSKSAVYIKENLANYYFERPGNSSNELENYTIKAFNQQTTVIHSIMEQVNDNSSIYSCIMCSLLYSVVGITDKCKIHHMNRNNAIVNDLLFFYKTINRDKMSIIREIKSNKKSREVLKRLKYFMILSFPKFYIKYL